MCVCSNRVPILYMKCGWGYSFTFLSILLLSHVQKPTSLLYPYVHHQQVAHTALPLTHSLTAYRITVIYFRRNTTEEESSERKSSASPPRPPTRWSSCWGWQEPGWSEAVFFIWLFFWLRNSGTLRGGIDHPAAITPESILTSALQ